MGKCNISATSIFSEAFVHGSQQELHSATHLQFILIYINDLDIPPFIAEYLLPYVRIVVIVS
jgi:hypothetical protein